MTLRVVRARSNTNRHSNVVCEICRVYVSEQTYQEVPYYLSANDREQATLEVSNRIAEMRRRIMQPNAPYDKTYGVARRTSPEAPAPAPAPAPATSPKVIHTVPSPM